MALEAFKWVCSPLGRTYRRLRFRRRLRDISYSASSIDFALGLNLAIDRLGCSSSKEAAIYRAHYFNFFRTFPQNHKVFVTMSFASDFKERFEKVIVPTVNRIELGGKRLEAFRVDN